MPEEAYGQAAPPPGVAGQVRYLRTETGQYLRTTATYRIHEGPNQVAALAFLQANLVTQQFLYLVIQTPDGTWARDVNGIYKEPS
jgi:hypothetical protein